MLTLTHPNIELQDYANSRGLEPELLRNLTIIILSYLFLLRISIFKNWSKVVKKAQYFFKQLGTKKKTCKQCWGLFSASD